MKSLSLRLPEALVASIEAEAHACHTTKSEVIRRRLEANVLAPASDAWRSLKKILEESWNRPARNVSPTYRSFHKQRVLKAIRGRKRRRR